MSTAATKPKVTRVREYVLNQLAAGTLNRGDFLPTEGELAKKLEVGRHSVRVAIGELNRSGIVQRVQGKGTFVSMQNDRKVDPGKKVDAYALVLPDFLAGICPSLISGFSQGADESRQQSVVVKSGDVKSQGDVILRLIHSGVSGVAIVPAPEPMPDYQLEVLRDHGIPVVFCHRHTAGIDAPLVRWPWEEVGQMAARTLADLGHRQIAFVDDAPLEPANHYILGMRPELSRRGIELPDEQVFLGARPVPDADEQKWEQEWDALLSRVLDRSDRATAVFCGDDYTSEHLYLAATQRGLRVPEDLSILGFGSTWRDGALRAKLAAVAIDEINLGRRAVQILDEMRRGTRPLDSNEVITVPLELFQGTSLGPPPRKN